MKTYLPDFHPLDYPLVGFPGVSDVQHRCKYNMDKDLGSLGVTNLVEDPSPILLQEIHEVLPYHAEVCGVPAGCFLPRWRQLS